jgi:hypothetical protein
MTPDEIASWLDKLYGDQDFTAQEFKTAFALSHAADVEGFIGPTTLAKIARADKAGDAAEPLADVLGHFVARGYLKGCGKRSGFRLVIAKAPAALPTATITPFPSARRGAFIRKHAERMTTLTPTHSDAHLRHQLKIQADTMRRRGISEETIAREIRSLESSIRTELWRLVLLADQPSGPA